MAAKQLRLGAFMRPISIHTGAWRYPGAWPDANFNLRLCPADPQAGGRPLRRLLHGRPHGRAEHAGGGAEAQPHHHLLRAADAAVGAGDGDGAHRADRHGQHDLQRPLPHRPEIRLARPYQRRPRGLEPGHHRQPRRGAEFRPGRAHGAWRALQARPRVLRGGHRALGQLRRRRLHPRRRERHLLRPRRGCMCWTTRARSCRSAAR